MKHNVKRHDVVQPLDQSYRYIPLTKGHNTIVDAEDFDFLNQWNWISNQPPRSLTPYVTRRPGILMHRVLMNCPDNLQIDHINGNGLDNRKCNLRFCTQSQNLRNKPKMEGTSSRYTGVHRTTYHTKNGPKILYVVQAHVKGKQQYLGCRKTEEEAARLRDSFIDEFSRPNFH